MHTADSIIPTLPNAIFWRDQSHTIDSLIEQGSHYLGVREYETGEYQLCAFETGNPSDRGYVLSPVSDNVAALVDAAWQRYGLVIDDK